MQSATFVLSFQPLQSAWDRVQALTKVHGFSKLAADIEASPNRFKEWYCKARPESAPLPLEWRKLDDHSPFMKLCVVRALRQDRMTTAMTSFVLNTLPDGKAYVECDAGMSFNSVLEVSNESVST